MGRRSLLKPEGYAKLLGVPSDEESLIRHYTLSPRQIGLAALGSRGQRGSAPVHRADL